MHVITCFTAAARYACVGWVRNTVLTELACLSLTASQREAIRLSVSEIVTNALNHGIGGESDSEILHVEAATDQTRGMLRVTVMNPCRTRTAPSALMDADLDAETGRGLFIVQTMADEVGWELRAGEGGTLWCAVWFELGVDLAQGSVPARVAELPRPMPPAVVQSAPARRSPVRRVAGRLRRPVVRIASWRRRGPALAGGRAA
ncbi:ATP-binding protein [Kitasatospora sp. NPDC059795]|uniref:ATP-binding protein n=1 Tax=Kitasatospora sp. NPDC059795 TaxID=3346949 RepID=UPI003650E9A0